MAIVENVHTLGATLGEGPAWIDDRLWFVDILEHRIHCFRPETSLMQTWAAPAPVGWVLPTSGRALMAGLRDGLYWFDPGNGLFTRYQLLEGEPAGNRLNDACVDSHGRLWFGTMDFDCAAPTGRLYLHDAGAIFDTGQSPIPVTNGPALSPDGNILYTVDTMAGMVIVHRINDDGSLDDGRSFIRIDSTEGLPDGVTIDAEGGVWIGLFGGWGVQRYDPAGVLIETVQFPCANVTKIAFGGDGLRTAYATTAATGLSRIERLDQPMAGDLFAFDAGVAGLPCPAIVAGHADNLSGRKSIQPR